MNTLNKILTKIAPKDKTELSSEKITLSKLSNIEDFISNAQYGLETFEDLLSDYKNAYTKASDVIKFDVNDAIIQAEGDLDDLLQDVKELGIDIPPKIKQAQKQILDLEGERKDAERRLESF